MTTQANLNCCNLCSGYFEHTVGSHSDDRGGDSDLPCYCNKNDCQNVECGCHLQLDAPDSPQPTEAPSEPPISQKASSPAPDKQEELSFSDLVQLVRKENPSLSYNKTAQVGEKVQYIGYTWKVIEVLPHGSRVMYRPWWKLRKTGLVVA